MQRRILRHLPFPLQRFLGHLSFARCGGMIVLLGCTYLAFLWWSLPDLRDASSLLASQSTVITDRGGIELYRLFSEQDRTFIPRSSIPPHVERAVLAIEDERFFEHGCVDIRAILRALLANVFRGFKSQGASTLTQQLARTALLTREKRISRKIKEIFLACSLERRFTKGELLELYLNWIPFGQNAYGIEQASKTYFGISGKDLSLAQAAVLASLPQRPSYFNPYGSHVRTSVSDRIAQDIRRGTITRISDIPEQDIIMGLLGSAVGSGSTSLYVGGRTDVVLRKMHNLGFISEQERLQALAELDHMTFTPYREDIRAPHFVLWIREEVERLLEGLAEENLLERGGLHIETTLDWELQQRAEKAVTDSMKNLSVYGIHNTALVAMDTKTRDILAYVGNMDFNDSTHEGKIDMARVPRQPGSSFKPFTYAAAFQAGYGPGTVLYDVPTKFGDDEPQNFDGKFWGLMTIRRALGASRNIPAVKAFFLAGGENPILQLAARMGVVSPKIQKGEHERSDGASFDYGWPLAIGAAEVPLLEMVHGYSTLADQGSYLPRKSLRRISDRNGNILFEAPPADAEQVLDPRIAYQITSILSDPDPRPNEYWRNVLSLPGTEAAAKTGTSNKCLRREEGKEGERKGEGACLERRPDNLWTIGYTPLLTVGVWVGNASNEPLAEKAESLVTAAPIWKAFMASALQALPEGPRSFPTPSGLLQPQISLLSGELPAPCTPVDLRKAELFLEEHPPTQPDPACTRILIDRVTNLRASDSCPPEAREERNFLVPRSILSARWPEWEKGVQEWAGQQMALWNATLNHSGSLLPLPLAPIEDCDIADTPGRLEKPTLHIQFPLSNTVVPFPSFRPQIDVTIGSHLRDLRFVVDGKLITSGTGSLHPILTMPKSIKPSGSHTLDITVIDQYFNEVKKSVSFRFGEDRSSPSIHFTSPQEGLSIRTGTEILLRAEAQDTEGGIKHVQFFLNDRLLTNDPLPPYELSYKADLKPGTYTIKARATDLAGNSEEMVQEINVEP